MHRSSLPTSSPTCSRAFVRGAPRVHCITNSVAQQYTANMLLAAGAVPSMTMSPDEIGAFVAGADALLVNLGTFDAERKSAVGVALASAAEHGVPWLLDPVFIERSPERAQFARDLVGRGPAVVRLNAAEFAALSGGESTADGPGALRASQRHHRGADRRDATSSPTASAGRRSPTAIR